MNNRHLLVAAVAAATLGMGTAHAGIFNPIGPQIREANTNWGLAFLEQRMNYAETPPPFQHYTTPPPNPLDSETGTIPGLEWFVGRQWEHFGFNVNVSVLYGHTHYQGVIENLTTGAFTPASTTTKDFLQGVQVRLDYGFSPARHWAILPGIVGGFGGWARDVGYNTSIGGDLETYTYAYYAGRLAVAYAMGPVVVDVHGDYGRTSSAELSDTYGKFRLGSTPWKQLGLRVTWNVDRRLSLFIKANRTQFGFGHSSLTQVWVEPTSTTTNTTAEIGFIDHNLL